MRTHTRARCPRLPRGHMGHRVRRASHYRCGFGAPHTRRPWPPPPQRQIRGSPSFGGKCLRCKNWIVASTALRLRRVVRRPCPHCGSRRWLMKPKRERLLPRHGPPCTACGKRPTPPRVNWGRFGGGLLPLARTHAAHYHHLCRRCFKKQRLNDRKTPRWGQGGGKTGATNRPTPTESPLNGATPPQLVPKPFPATKRALRGAQRKAVRVGCKGAKGAACTPLRRRPLDRGPPPARWWAFDANCRGAASSPIGGTPSDPIGGYARQIPSGVRRQTPSGGVPSDPIRGTPVRHPRGYDISKVSKEGDYGAKVHRL